MSAQGQEPRPRLLSELQAHAHELPPFTPQIVSWVKWSIDRLPKDNPKILTDTFYRLLFELAPNTRSMFPEDLTPQRDRLFGALIAAAKGLEQPERVEQALRRWGVTHQRTHGVTEEMYVYVGQALVRTFKELLTGTDSMVMSSWVSVYQWMAAVMIDEAQKAALVDQNPESLMGPWHEEQPVSDQQLHAEDYATVVTQLRPRRDRAEAARRRAAGG
jgi:hemoglobin-like flavoprotein